MTGVTTSSSLPLPIKMVRLSMMGGRGEATLTILWDSFNITYLFIEDDLVAGRAGHEYCDQHMIAIDTKTTSFLLQAYLDVPLRLPAAPVQIRLHFTQTYVASALHWNLFGQIDTHYSLLTEKWLEMY